MITITKPDKGEEQKLMDDLRKTIEKFYSGDVSPTEFCFQDMDIENIKGAMRFVASKEELEKAIKDKEKYIYIEGDLKNKYLRKKDIKDLSWSVFGGSLCAAIGSFFLFSLPVTSVALGLVAVSGGIGAIMSLKGDYNIVYMNANGIILKRK